MVAGMGTRLDQIVAATRRRVADAKSSVDMRQLERKAQAHVPRGFRRALAHSNLTGAAVIAELKKASPSRGLIRADFDPAHLAGELETAGAAALSVLTDEEFFQGSLENLRYASGSTRLPCLRKDFIVDEFQLLEARAYSGDAILLIVAVLSQDELIALAMKARALDAGCDLVGVNNRNLHTFAVDPQTTLRLAELIPHNVMAAAESGIENGSDIARLRAAGYQAFLIGESVMRAKSPGEALRSLLAEAAREPSQLNAKS